MAASTTPGTAATTSGTAQPGGSYAPSSNAYTPGGNYSPGGNSYAPGSNGYQPANNGYSPPGSTPYTSPAAPYSTPTGSYSAPSSGSDDPHYRPGSTSDWNPRNVPSTSNPNSVAPSYGYPSSQPSQNSASVAGGVMPASYAQPSPITTIPSSSGTSTAGLPTSTMR
jgi:hypothetical protein